MMTDIIMVEQYAMPNAYNLMSYGFEERVGLYRTVPVSQVQ